MNCLCINNDVNNDYVSNNIMNPNLCYLCDSESYKFIHYLRYTNQLSYYGIIQKLVRYNKKQDLFYNKAYIIYRKVFAARQALKIPKELWDYDIPDPRSNIDYGEFRIIEW